MEESSRIKMEEVKSKNVEVIKDTNNEPDIVNDLAEQKKKEREERKCLIQLIVVFVVWVTLIIILMRTEKRPTPAPVKQKVVATPAKAHHRSHNNHKLINNKFLKLILKHRLNLRISKRFRLFKIMQSQDIKNFIYNFIN